MYFFSKYLLTHIINVRMKNVNFLLFFFLLPLAGIYSQGCQDSIKYNMTYSYDGPELFVDINVENFNNIIGFQFGLNYDPEVIQLEEMTSVINSFGQVNYSEITSGNIRILWNDNNVTQGSTIADNNPLIQLRFSVIQDASSSAIYISDQNIPSEFVNVDNQVYCFKGTDINITTNPGKIAGFVTRDENLDCTYQSGEIPLKNWLVELTSGNKKYYRTTDENGYYSYGLPAGDYTLKLLPKNDLWNVCGDPVTISLPDAGIETLDLMANSSFDCSLMFVDISSPFLRRCFDNTYTLVYENQGTSTSEGTTIEVDFDEDFIFVSTDYSDYTVIGSKIIFNIGDLEEYEGGVIHITFNLDCENTVLGQTHCVTATAFPHEPCVISPNWSGSIIQVTAECDEITNKVRFVIENVGTGDMQNLTEFIVTEDDILKPGGTFKLNATETYISECDANGSTFRLSTFQESGFPGQSQPSVAVEGCGTDEFGNFSIGYYTMFQDDDQDSYIDIDCKESIGSYDPNDITGFPKGYGSNQYIEKDIQLEYLIRFQNTGTDTAFTVVIKNYLPATLDITTIELGASSHPYTYDFNQDRELIVRFDNILLVDSTKNEPASHGFVKYKIHPSAELVDEDRILNDAKIYFDFNAPILTNEERHTIGRDFVLSSINWVGTPIDLEIYPNPTTDALLLDIRQTDLDNVSFRILHTDGQLVRNGLLNSGKNMLGCSDLSRGTYILEVFANGQQRGTLSFIKI